MNLKSWIFQVFVQEEMSGFLLLRWYFVKLHEPLSFTIAMLLSYCQA